MYSEVESVTTPIAGTWAVRVKAAKTSAPPTGAVRPGSQNMWVRRSKCQALFNALGYTGIVQPGHRDDGKGIGCHRYDDGNLWWLDYPDFVVSHNTVSSQIVCACTE